MIQVVRAITEPSITIIYYCELAGYSMIQVRIASQLLLLSHPLQLFPEDSIISQFMFVHSDGSITIGYHFQRKCGSIW
jgi:hypothetical protein